jgi:molybdopterin molybdotransferase
MCGRSSETLLSTSSTVASVVAQSPTLRSVAAVLADLKSACRPNAPQAVLLKEALGQILAEDLVAPASVPPKPVALRSGFAVAAHDLVGVSAYAPLPVANAPPRVAPGDDLPPGCDAVLLPDGVITTGLRVEIAAAALPGENVRRAGEDLRPGQLLRRKGEALRAIDGAVAVTAGLRQAIVRPASLLVLANEDNDEVVQWLAAAPCSGARTRRQSLPAGSNADWQTALTSSKDDVILALGYSPSALFDACAGGVSGAGRILARGLALAGAETALVTLVGPQAVIFAPPRLDAIVALTLCVIEPFLDHMTGRHAAPVWRRAPLSRKLSSSIGLTEVALLREAEGQLEPLAGGFLPLAALARAEGYLVIPPESEGLQAGEVVEAHGF